jgi:hypothetical protein
MNMKKNQLPKLTVLPLCAILLICTEYAFAESTSQQVDWRLPGGGKIKRIRYQEQPKPAAAKSSAAATRSSAATASPSALPANSIDSPPVDGFTPWIVVITTNKHLDDMTWDAVVEPTLSGTPTASDIQNNYALGIFDTGASAHIFGYQNAVTAGLFNSTYKTNNTTTITGVTGSVDAWVSQPIGVFAKGLAALEPNSQTDPEAKLTSTAGFVGESNVSIILGPNPGSLPDLNSAIGSPFSVYFNTWIRNDNPITITRNGQQITSPDIRIYSQNDSAAPSYVNKLPLELRPLGGTSVQYIAYNMDDLFTDIFNITFEPTTPSIIVGNSYQSLFFVHSVDLTKGTHSATDKSRFMLDTGAQITVIGSRIAARLALKPTQKDFEVEIEGVTGETSTAPGFYIDSLTIPTIGDWLEYTNVPVIMLDIASPEGGTLDGIIGMNLFTEYNLILRGGGLFLQEDPVLEFKRIGQASLAGDIAPPPDGDGKIDAQDFNAYSQLWMTTAQSPDWNPAADIAPQDNPDGIINIADLLRLAQNWLAGTD